MQWISLRCIPLWKFHYRNGWLILVLVGPNAVANYSPLLNKHGCFYFFHMLQKTPKEHLDKVLFVKIKCQHIVYWWSLHVIARVLYDTIRGIINLNWKIVEILYDREVMLSSLPLSCTGNSVLNQLNKNRTKRMSMFLKLYYIETVTYLKWNN